MNDIEELSIGQIDESQLPSVISSQFNALIELEDNVQKSINMAAQAKQKAEDAQVSAGMFKKKEAIELLQDATIGLAEAQITAADAQKISFEYQTGLTKITKFLFGLGLSNIAMNRSVVRELELKLKGASEEEISDLAKQELKNVVIQLKAREDIEKKQEFLSNKLKEQVKKAAEHGCLIAEQADKAAEHDRLIAEQADKAAEHDRLIAEQAEKDTEHDRLIAKNAQKNIEQDKLITELISTIKNYDKLLVKQGSEIKQLNEEVKLLRSKLNRSTWLKNRK